MFAFSPKAHLLSACLLLGGALCAQTFRGGIAGSVSDQSGAAIPGAKVTILHPGTGFTRSQDTTASGDFSFQDLPLGKYTVTIERSEERRVGKECRL